MTGRQQIHTCNKEAEIAVMQRDLAYIKETVTETNHKLLGNGKPGILEEHAKKINDLDKRMAYYIGAAAVITFIVTLLADKVVAAMFG